VLGYLSLVNPDYGLGPGLYYGLNPLACGLLVAAALQMAVVEMLVSHLRARWPLLVVGLVATAGVVYALLASRYGSTIAFYAYLDGYRRLFGY
jgi:hypothetical protein